MILHHGSVDGLKTKEFILITGCDGKIYTYINPLTTMHGYLNQVVEDPRMQGFGESVPSVTGLLHVQSYVDGFLGTPPLAVHLPARQLLLETVLIDPEQKRRKC